MARMDPGQFAIEIARLAADNKAEDIAALDVHGLSPLTDYLVICTGTSDRQMRAVADRVIEYGKKMGDKPYRITGYGSDTWVIVDFVDVVLHVFSAPYREYYDLELLWGDAPRLPLSRSESA